MKALIRNSAGEYLNRTLKGNSPIYLKLESYEAFIGTDNGRVKVGLLHGTYQGKFKVKRVGQVWLVKGDDELYLNVVSSNGDEPKICLPKIYYRTIEHGIHK